MIAYFGFEQGGGVACKPRKAEKRHWKVTTQMLRRRWLTEENMRFLREGNIKLVAGYFNGINSLAVNLRILRGLHADNPDVVTKEMLWRAAVEASVIAPRAKPWFRKILEERLRKEGYDYNEEDF